MEILDVFQAIDNLGHYTNEDWFTNLNRIDLIRFIRELSDIYVGSENFELVSKYSVYELALNSCSHSNST